MSGCGRKHLAKHLTQQFLDENWDGLDTAAGERLAIVACAPQGKIVPVRYVVNCLASGVDGNAIKDLPTENLILPGRFYKVVWLGIGDCIIARDQQVDRKLTSAHLKNWLGSPAADDASNVELRRQVEFVLGTSEVEGPQPSVTSAAEDEGEEEEEDDPLMSNPNRRGHAYKYVAYKEEEDEECGEDEEEDDEDDGEEA